MLQDIWSLCHIKEQLKEATENQKFVREKNIDMQVGKDHACVILSLYIFAC